MLAHALVHRLRLRPPVTLRVSDEPQPTADSVIPLLHAGRDDATSVWLERG
jgi:hypothetical protein